MCPYRQALHVLEYECPRFQFSNKPDELENQAVSWIFQGPVADQREALARRSAEYTVDSSAAQSGGKADIRSFQSDYRPAENRSFRRVELVNGTMHGVDFDSRCDIESGLFEAEAHTARSGEEVYGNWTWHRRTPNISRTTLVLIAASDKTR
jgi:hypothetical protein